jgi:LPS export ABC transporter permease LptG
VVQPASVLKMRAITAGTTRIADITTEIRPRVFFTQFPGVVVFVQEVDPKKPGVLDRVLVYKSESGSSSEQITVARAATVIRDRASAGDLLADFRDGVTHRFRTGAPEGYQRTAFERGYEKIPLPGYLKDRSGGVSRAPGDMALGELLQERRAAEDEKDPIIRPLRIRAAAIELQSRLALPFACFFFALLAAPLGITRVRSGKGAGFALSLGLILLYWLVHTTLQKQALEGRVPVVPALWAANGVMFLLAIAAYARIGASRAGRIREVVAAWSKRLVALLPSGSPTIPSEGSAAAPENWIPQIDRYIGLTFLRNFGLSLAFCWMVVFLFEIKSLADALPARSAVPGLRFAAYFLHFTPGSLGLAVPVAALVGAVVTCTLFARSGELIAMRASGMSATRVAYPILLLTAVLAATAFLVQDRIAPHTNSSAQALKDEILKRPPRTYGAAPGGRWIFGSAGRLYHYRLFDPELRQFRGLSVFTVDLQNPDITSHTTSPTVRWDGKAWKAEGGWSRSFRHDAQTSDLRTLGAGEAIDIDPPEHFSQRERTMVRENDLPEQMSLEDLGAQIRAIENSGFDTTKLRVAWHVKLARSVTPLVMVILGLPFAFRVGRRGSLYGVGVSLLLVLAYWAAFAITNALGTEGALPAAVAAWTPNVLFAALGGWMMSLVRS